MLYVRALEKVLNERDIKRSQYAQAKRVCEAALQEIRVALQNQQVSDGNGRSTPDPSIKDEAHSGGDQNKVESSSLLQSDDMPFKIDSEKFFIPFEMACQCQDSPKVTNAALDGLQKLLAHGQITGNYANPANPNKKLIDRIVETICSCFEGTETDEGVELQIIKALLTIVTSQHVQIHEGTILLTLRTCYNIYLSTRNTVNQITARAMLTQMLNSIFSRMEIALEGKSEGLEDYVGENNNNCSGITTLEILEHVTTPLKDWDWQSITWYRNLDFSVPSYSAVQNATEQNEEMSDQPKDDVPHFENVKLRIQRQDSEEQCNNNEEAIEKTTENGVDFETNFSANFDAQKDETVVEEKNLESEVKAPSVEKLSNGTRIQEEQLSKINENISSKFIHVLQKDAFLTFWALCKLAVKPSLSAEGGNTEIINKIETNSKILSFQLLKSILENCGTVFQTSPIFITAIKQYLCTAMSQAAVSPILEVFQINLDLLGFLIQKFRNILKDEIEKLCEEILFPVLESSSGSSEYKLLVLGMINKLCSDVKCLVEIYINYDSPGSPESKIYERIIRNLCKISQDKQAPETSTINTTSAASLRILAIESAVTILNTMARSLPKNESPKVYAQENTETIIVEDKTTSDALNSDESGDLNTQVSAFVKGLLSLVGNISNSADVLAIDILVQKFAQKICDSSLNCEKYDKFESADNVYALVYTTISLIGDLSHKSQGKGKISREQFAKMNNNGTNGCEPISQDYVSKVYDEIEEYLTQHNISRKRQIVDVKSQNVVNNAKRLIAVVGLQQSLVSSDKQVRCIRRMFKVMGKSVMVALLGTLTESDDTTISDVCLSGMQSAIHIASVLTLKNERDAFVQALSRLTLASLKEIKSRNANAMVITSKTSSMTTTENGVTKTTITTTTETKCRNVDIIQTLLNVAIHEGNYLGNSWLDILKCVSQLEAAQLVRDTSSNSRSSSPNPNAQNAAQQNSKSWYAWAGSLVPKMWDSTGNKLDMDSVKESMGALVNQLFINSTKLDGNGIVDFFKALCQVSLIEITHPENPRSFVYEKLFEVAHINMERPCCQWSNIWQVLADYFSHLACSSDEDVSYFAIDSVTKLAVYLLQKETLGNFRFQNHFLSPFETIMKNTPFITTREYVLESVSKIVQANCSELRSGWRTIFKILEMNIYSGDSNNSVVSFLMVQNILEMFEKGEVNLIDSFEEIVRTLKDFSFQAPSAFHQSESMELIKKIAKLVHDKPELFLRDLEDRKVDRVWLKGWYPIFNELSNVVIEAEAYGFDDRMQATALSMLFELIKSYGNSFTTSWWKSLFQILFKIFNKLKLYEENIVFAIVDTFIRHYEVIGTILLEDILNELQWCISQAHEQIALSGVQCLHQIIRMLDTKFSLPQWNIICKMTQNLLRNSFQKPDIVEEPELETKECCQSNSIVQLEILKLVKSVVFSPFDQTNTTDETEIDEENGSDLNTNHPIDVLRNILEVDQLFLFLDVLEECIRFTKNSVNSQDKASHEALSTDILLRLLFQMYNDRSWSQEYFEKIEIRLKNNVSNALIQFTTIDSKDYRDVLTDIVEFCLESIRDLPTNKFKMFTSNYYPLLCDMLEVELKPTLSVSLCKYFLQIGRSIDICQESNLSNTHFENNPVSFQINYTTNGSLPSPV